MAEKGNEIIYVVSDDEDDSSTRSTNNELRNNAIIKEELPSKSSMCANCMKEFPDINNHLSSECACFYPLTERYWYKPQGEEQLCKICEENLKDKLKLKSHCFNNEKCRDMYIIYYMRKVPCREKATVVSADTDVKFELPSSSEPKVGHPDSSSKRGSELHALPGPSGVFSHNQDARTPVRVTLAVKPSAAASVTNNTEAMSSSAPDIAEKRATKRNRSPNLTCENCKKKFETSDDFLLHALKKSRCFSYYESANTEVSVPYCFQCKRCFQTSKLCIEHKCIGLVKHKCPQCDNIFGCISNLTKHASSSHNRK